MCVQSWRAFPHPLSFLPMARGEMRLSVLSMQFGALHSLANSLPCYTIFGRMPETCLACFIMLRCPLCHVLGCARYRTLGFVCADCSHLIRACVMVGWNTHVFCTVIKGLHIWGEDSHAIIPYFLSCNRVMSLQNNC